MMAYSDQIKKSIHGDEYYSPQNVVDMIVPYIIGGGYSKIWCPFDKADSKFVTTFQDLGLDVIYGHIETGQDFFLYERPQGEIVVSNPPFSKRDAIFEKLYQWGMPFALVLNFNGLFDSKKRSKLFREYGVEMLVPYGRMRFIQKDDGIKNSPNFQSVYVCNKLLKDQIVFSDAVFGKEQKK